MGTPSATDEFSEAYEIGRPYDPTEFSDRYYSGKISGTAYDPTEFSKIYPPVSVTQPPFNYGQINNPRSSENPYFPSIRTVNAAIVSNAANNNPVNAESASFSVIQDVKKNKASGGNTFANLIASQTAASTWNRSGMEAAKRAIAEDAKKDRPVFSGEPTPNDMGNPAFGVYKGSNFGFNRGGRVGYQTGDVVEGQPQLPEVVGGQMPSQVPDQQTVADNQKDT